MKGLKDQRKICLQVSWGIWTSSWPKWNPRVLLLILSHCMNFEFGDCQWCWDVWCYWTMTPRVQYRVMKTMHIWQWFSSTKNIHYMYELMGQHFGTSLLRQCFSGHAVTYIKEKACIRIHDVPYQSHPIALVTELKSTSKGGHATSEALSNIEGWLLTPGVCWYGRY